METTEIIWEGDFAVSKDVKDKGSDRFRGRLDYGVIIRNLEAMTADDIAQWLLVSCKEQELFGSPGVTLKPLEEAWKSVER